MKKILAFNWKMDPQSLNEAKRLFNIYLKNLRSTNYNLQTTNIICPPFVYLESFLNLLKPKTKNLKPKLGVQNVFWENSGHYTGEISPKMLKNSGVEYVIIGHSERRQHLNETDEMINKKVLATLKTGLKVILCVSEPKRELRIMNYESPHINNYVGDELRIKKAKNYVKNQLQTDLKGISTNYKLQTTNLIIAYEPVWAIGANHSDTPEDAVEMIKFIKNFLKPKTYNLKPKVLYGGSVNGKNIKNFVEYDEIDGFLIGGASLKPKEIKSIIKISE